MSQAVNLDSLAMLRVLAAIELATEPFTVRELGERAHVEHENLRSRVMPVLVREGKLHAVGWRTVPMGRRPTEWMAGPGKSPKRPKFNKVIAARKWKRKHNYHALQIERTKRRRAIERNMKVVASAPSPLLGLLMMGSQS